MGDKFPYPESDLSTAIFNPNEGAIALRIYQAVFRSDEQRVLYWDQWLSASRETEELREQSWQMGRALTRLFVQLEAEHLNSESSSETIDSMLGVARSTDGRSPLTPHRKINYATAFSIAAAYHHIPLHDMLLGYLHSWASNLVGAGVKLVPLGQTEGQQVLCQLYSTIQQTVTDVATLSDDDLSSCTWGLAIASMNHETVYSRLFRS